MNGSDLEPMGYRSAGITAVITRHDVTLPLARLVYLEPNGLWRMSSMAIISTGTRCDPIFSDIAGLVAARMRIILTDHRPDRQNFISLPTRWKSNCKNCHCKNCQFSYEDCVATLALSTPRRKP